MAAEAIPCWQRAGTAPSGRSAHSEASRPFRARAGAGAGAAAARRRHARVGSGPRSRRSARASLGSRASAAPETERVYARAQALCAEPLGDTPSLPGPSWGSGGSWSSKATRRSRWRSASSLLARATARATPPPPACDTTPSGRTDFFRGEVVASIERMEAGLALYDPIPLSVAGRHVAAATTRASSRVSVASHPHASCADIPSKPPRALGKLIELAKQLGHPHSLANGLLLGGAGARHPLGQLRARS